MINTSIAKEIHDEHEHLATWVFQLSMMKWTWKFSCSCLNFFIFCKFVHFFLNISHVHVRQNWTSKIFMNLMKNVYVHAWKKDEHFNKFDVHVCFRTLLRVNSIQKPSTTRSFTSFSKTKIFRMVDRQFRIIIDESSGHWLAEFFSASIWIFQIWIRERMKKSENEKIREKIRE